MDLPYYREYDLPWNTDTGQERKFQRLLGFIFLGVAVMGLVWPFIPTTKPDPDPFAGGNGHASFAIWYARDEELRSNRKDARKMLASLQS